MQAEIITIGDEILIGQITDTNSAWLGKRLNESGIRIGRITSVQDEKKEIADGISQAMDRCGLVFVTGGLGPTKDDITKTTLAEYFGVRLVRHLPTYEYLRKRMAERGFDFNLLNQAQADVPEGCEVIPNDNGTAPGMWFEKDGKILVSMPGVPFEMKAMVENEILPRLSEKFRLGRYVHKTAITFGIPESKLAIMLSEWEDVLPDDLKLAYLPNPNGIRLRLSNYGNDPEGAEKRIMEQFGKVREIISDHFLGFESASVEGNTADMLKVRGETLGVAESCTGGAIAVKFTAMPGASEYFRGAVVAYTEDVKAGILGVGKQDIQKYGVVSRQVAEQMAAGVARVTGSTYGLGTTGVAGPAGGTEENPVGTVWMSVYTPEGFISEKMNFGNLRDVTVERASSYSIDMLYRYLLKKNKVKE